MDWKRVGTSGHARRIATTLAPAKPWVVSACSRHARFSRWYAARTHEALFAVQWGVPPTPEWFDHDIDAYFTNHAGADDLAAQRGVFSRIALESAHRDREAAGIEGEFRVLDLCVGDGSTPARYLTQRSDTTVGVDFDPEAVGHARARYSNTGVEYTLGDIRDSLPEGPWDLIVWDAAIEHFTMDETRSILQRMKGGLRPWGRLCGYTLKAAETGSHLEHHEHEYASAEELGEIIHEVFDHVSVFEILSAERVNWYFTASVEGVSPVQFAFQV